MVSLVNGDGNNSGGYTFDDSDDTDGANDSTPLVRAEPTDNTANTHIHIITGYVSIIETLLLLTYFGTYVGLSLSLETANQSYQTKCLPATNAKYCTNRMLIALSCIAHSFLWLLIASIDRLVQWQHQVMRRKGYLKFYRRMKNIRRVPFIIFSTGTALLLIFVSLLYLFDAVDCEILFSQFKIKHILALSIGLEVLLSSPCLIYYIVQAAVFNYRRPPPDVIQETSSIANSPTATLTTVGFRDGEDLDELLERQADMIRYLQQHNASLGRRIMELQSRTME